MARKFVVQSNSLGTVAVIRKVVEANLKVQSVEITRTSWKSAGQGL